MRLVLPGRSLLRRKIIRWVLRVSSVTALLEDRWLFRLLRTGWLYCVILRYFVRIHSWRGDGNTIQWRTFIRGLILLEDSSFWLLNFFRFRLPYGFRKISSYAFLFRIELVRIIVRWLFPHPRFSFGFNCLIDVYLWGWKTNRIGWVVALRIVCRELIGSFVCWKFLILHSLSSWPQRRLIINWRDAFQGCREYMLLSQCISYITIISFEP